MAKTSVLILIAEIVLGAAAVFLLMRKLTPSMLARMRSNDRAHYASWWLRSRHHAEALGES